MTGKVGSLNLDTGQLTAEQVNLMLTHLPVDLSFVNENDEVIYYSNTEDRIFPRSPASSAEGCRTATLPGALIWSKRSWTSLRLETRTPLISGSRCAAFIFIRYFAMRDSKGTYKGCLEVSQDVTEYSQPAGTEASARLVTPISGYTKKAVSKATFVVIADLIGQSRNIENTGFPPSRE